MSYSILVGMISSEIVFSRGLASNATSASASIAARRISYFFNLKILNSVSNISYS